MGEYAVSIMYRGVIEQDITAEDLSEAECMAEDIAMMEVPLEADEYVIDVSEY